MARPSGPEIEEALAVMRGAGEASAAWAGGDRAKIVRAMDVLREAVNSLQVASPAVRPNGPEVHRALELTFELAEVGARSRREGGAMRELLEARRVLCRAVRPRPVMLSKEAAAALGVEPANLRPDSVADLPEPAQVVPRPTSLHPDRVVRLWYADEIEACAAAKRARATGANERNGEET